MAHGVGFIKKLGNILNIRKGRARTRRKTKMIAFAAAFTAVMTVAGAGAATAAEYDYPAAIDPDSIVIATVDSSETVTRYERIRVDANWAVPDSAVGGQTFGFTLPRQFGRVGMTFAMPSSEDPSATVAECALSSDAAPVVTCTLTDYVNGRTDVSGSLWFVVSADEQTTESTVEFVIDAEFTRVPIPGGGIGPSGPLPTNPQKWSWQTDGGRIAWEFALPGVSFEGADSIVIDDTLTAADSEYAEHHNEDGNFNVWSTDLLDQNETSISNWTGAWNAQGTAFVLEIPGPIDPDRMYFVKYYTVPSSQAAGVSYNNVADVNGIVLRDTQVWRSTGGGEGIGTTAAATGGFTLTKAVDGSGASDVPSDAVYKVRYSYGDPAVEHTVSVTAGQTAPRIELPAGTVVTLAEVTPPSVEGIAWGTPAFSGTGVRTLADGAAQITVGNGTTLAVTLSNTAEETPPPPPTATPPPELALAATGGDVPAGFVWAGGTVLLLGIALTALAAARARTHQRQG